MKITFVVSLLVACGSPPEARYSTHAPSGGERVVMTFASPEREEDTDTGAQESETEDVYTFYEEEVDSDFAELVEDAQKEASAPPVEIVITAREPAPRTEKEQMDRVKVDLHDAQGKADYLLHRLRDIDAQMKREDAERRSAEAAPMGTDSREKVTGQAK